MEGADFKYYSNLFKDKDKKDPNRALFVPNLDIFIISQYFQFKKIQVADFKYDNIFFQNSSPKVSKYSSFDQKYSNKAFLVPNLSIFASV